MMESMAEMESVQNRVQPPRRRERSSGEAILWLGGAYVVALLGQLATSALGARVLGVNAFGDFVAVITLTTLMSQLGLLGAQTLALRDSASMREHPDPALLAEHRTHARSLLTVALPLVSLGTGTTVALLYGTSLVGKTFLLAGVSLLVYLGGVQKLAANYLRGFGVVRFSALLEGRSGGAILLCGQAAVLIVVWGLLQTSTLEQILPLLALSAVPSSWLAWHVAKRWLHGRIAKSLYVADLRALLSKTWGFVALQVATFLDLNLEVFLAVLVLAATGASDFTAALRVALIVIMPQALFQLVASPLLVRSRYDPMRFDSLVRSLAFVSAVTGLALALPLVVWGEHVLNWVYGPAFKAQWILSILAASFACRSLLGVAPLVLAMTGGERSLATGQWISISIRCVVSSIAGFLYGGIGLAIASASIGLTMAAWFVVVAHRRLGVWAVPTLRPKLRMLARLPV